MSYSIFIPEGGLGKIIASTAVAENIKLAYPDRELIVVTPWPEVYLNNPNISRIYRSGNTPYFYKDYIYKKDSLIFKAEPYFTTDHLHQRKHVVESWCDILKIECKIKLPKLYYNPRELTYIDRKYRQSKPICIFQTTGGMYGDNSKPYCWTRDFPVFQAQVVVDSLKEKYDIFHIGRSGGYELKDVNRIGELPKRELLSLLLVSSKRILIDSCMQHAAAAFNLPSTVCWVGTSPTTFGYNIHNNITPEVEKDIECLVDSFIFDYSFEGAEHQYPYSTNSLFNLEKIIN